MLLEYLVMKVLVSERKEKNQTAHKKENNKLKEKNDVLSVFSRLQNYCDKFSTRKKIT